MENRGKKKLSQEVADQAFTAAQFTPLEPYTGANVPRSCRCDICGNECRVTYSSVRVGKRGCKVCKGRLIGGKKRLEPALVEAVFASAKLTPLEPYVGANTPRLCICQICGTKGKPRYATLQQGQGGCKPCGYVVVRRKLQELKTDLKAIDLVYERAELTPLEPWVAAHTPRLTRCNRCGHEARVRYGGIYSGQGGCIKCGAAARGFLQRNPAELVESVFRNANLEPLEEYPGTDVRRKCRCLECGEIVFTMYKDLAGKRKRAGCRFCAYRKMGDRKLLPTDVVDAFFHLKGLEPIDAYKGAAEPRRCICMKCNREVSPAYNSIKSGQGGCKYCAPQGLQRAEPGLLYLIKNEEFRVLKIGVTSGSARKNRLKSHTDRGWLLVQDWDLIDAGLAEALETSVLRHWRKNLGAPPAMRKEDMPQSGYSETVAMFYVTEEDALSTVNELISRIDN